MKAEMKFKRSSHVRTLTTLVGIFLILTFASSAAWAQGLPIKTCSNGRTAYLCKGDIIVADGNASGGNGRVILVNPSTGEQTLIAQGLPYMTESAGVVFDPTDSQLLVTDRYNGLIRVNPATGSQTQFSTGFNDPFGLTLDATGNIWVADSGYRATSGGPPEVNVPGRIIKVDRTTGTHTVWAQGGPGSIVGHPYGVAFDPLSGLIYVSDANSFTGQGAIYSLNPASIASPPVLIWGPGTANPPPQVAQVAPMGCPLGITVEGDGNILATVFSYPLPPDTIYGCVPPGIFRVNLASNTQVTITSNATNPPLSWNLPFGIDTEANGNIIVGDEGSGALYRLSATIPFDPDNRLANFIFPIPLSPPPGTTNLTPQPVSLDIRRFDPTANISDPGPGASISGVPSSSPEGTAINLTSIVTGTIGTVTYAWTVTKNGGAYATGSAANLTFTPDDNGTYVVTLNVTHGGPTLTDTETINATNMVPTVGVTGAPSFSVINTPITLSAVVSDPSSVDTAAGFIYAWTVTRNAVVVATGAASSLTFTPDVNGSYVATLTATDKDGGSGSTSRTINVGAAPVALPLKICPSGKTGYLCKGDIVVADGNADSGRGRVILVNPATGAQTLIAQGAPYMEETAGVVFDPNDSQLVLTDRYNGIIRVNPATGVQTQISTGFNDPFGLTIDNLGNIWVADSGYRATDPNNAEINVPGRIVKVDRTTGAKTVWAQGGPGSFISHPYGVVFDPLSGLLYVSDANSFSGQGAIYSLNPTNISAPPTLIWGPGSATPAPRVAQVVPMGCPLGITVEGDGNILATVFSYPAPPNTIYGCVPPGIFRVNLITNTQVTISHNATNPPLSWNLPFGIDTEANGNIIVGDEGSGNIYRLSATIPFDPNNRLANFIFPIPVSPQGGTNLVPNPVSLNIRRFDPTVNIAFPPPTVAINGAPASSPEATSISLTSTAVNHSGMPLTLAWTVAKNGASFATGSGASLTFTPDDNGTYVVTLTVTNVDGTGTDTKTINVTNVQPVVTSFSAGPSAIAEGMTVNAAGTFTDPGTLDTHVVTINWGDGSVPTIIPLAAGVLTFATTHQYRDDNPTGTSFDVNSISVIVADNAGDSGTAGGTVTVSNVAPVVTGLPALVSIGTATSVSANYVANFTDLGTDTHTCTISWDEGAAAVPGVITETNGNGTCTGTNTYTGTGIHSVTVTVTDDDGGSATDKDFIVVFDPTVGFVSGAGFINSPAGAYPANAALTGKANFGFNTRYKLNSTVPTGPSHFNFNVANLSFAGVVYEWLLVNAPSAQFKGSGTINGAGNYGFMVTGLDGHQVGGSGVDKFRIKIWNINSDGSAGSIVYDNVMGAPDTMDFANMQAIGAGTILVFLDTAPSAVTLTTDATSYPENAQIVALTGAFTDPDLGDPHTVTINWGDGATTTIERPNGYFTFTASHYYADDDPTSTPSDGYTITATVSDDYGKVSLPSTKPVTITNTTPLLTGETWPGNMVAIGTPVTVSATFTDPGIRDTHTCLFTWGDSTTSNGTVTETHPPLLTQVMNGSCTANHTYTTGGDYNVTVTLSDDDGGSMNSSGIVVYVNAPVSISALSVVPTTINENGIMTINGTIADANLSLHTITINWADGTPNTTVILNAAQQSFTVDHVYKDDKPTGPDVYTIQVTASDGVGADATSSVSVTVNNVAPNVSSVTGASPVNPNVATTITANFSDPGTLDTRTCAFSWGDGSTDPGTITYGSGTCSASHSYSAIGSYTVTVTVTDDDGGSNSGTKTVVVNAVNGAPVISSSSATPNPVGENVNTALSGTFTDSGDTGSHTVTIVWGDGTANTTFTLAGGVFSFSNKTHKYLDDGVYTINLTVKDSANLTDTGSTTVTVNNTIPNISSVLVNNVANTNTVLLGSAATVKANYSDASPQDTHTCLIAWGDGSTDSPTPNTSGSDFCQATHTYAASGNYSGQATVTDDDGGVFTKTFTVKVTVAPTMSLANLSFPSAVTENATVSYSGTFTDPDAGDTHKVTITWGDGTNNTVINLAAGVLNFSATHKYMDDNPTATSSDAYNITVTVADGNNAAAPPVATTVTVNNSAPVITTVGQLGSTNPLWIDFVDAGTQDTHTAVINWGDGTSSPGVINESGGSGYLNASHNYANPGTYTVTVTVTDDDGGTTSSAFTYVKP